MWRNFDGGRVAATTMWNNSVYSVLVANTTTEKIVLKRNDFYPVIPAKKKLLVRNFFTGEMRVIGGNQEQTTQEEDSNSQDSNLSVTITNGNLEQGNQQHIAVRQTNQSIKLQSEKDDSDYDSDGIVLPTGGPRNSTTTPDVKFSYHQLYTYDGSFIFLGETDKYAPVARQRFGNIRVYDRNTTDVIPQKPFVLCTFDITLGPSEKDVSVSFVRIWNGVLKVLTIPFNNDATHEVLLNVVIHVSLHVSGTLSASGFKQESLIYS